MYADAVQITLTLIDMHVNGRSSCMARINKADTGDFNKHILRTYFVSGICSLFSAYESWVNHLLSSFILFTLF